NWPGVENGVADGRIVDKGLHSSDGDGALDIKTRAFRAVVIEIHHQSGGKLALDIKIPDLHVAEAIVGIDSEIVGDSGVYGGKSVLQRKRIRGGANIGGSNRKWRL